MKINAAGRFQYPAKLDQPWGHHRRVRQHVIFAEKGSECLHRLRNFGVRALDHFLVCLGGGAIPMPCITERLDLGGGS
jgi:hypothetical protein